MALDASESLKSLEQDFNDVPLSDISQFLHHKTQMTFTATNVVGSDPTVGAAQIDPNLSNPWYIDRKLQKSTNSCPSYWLQSAKA